MIIAPELYVNAEMDRRIAQAQGRARGRLVRRVSREAGPTTGRRVR